jgi:hypothetical protein
VERGRSDGDRSACRVGGAALWRLPEVSPLCQRAPWLRLQHHVSRSSLVLRSDSPFIQAIGQNRAGRAVPSGPFPSARRKGGGRRPANAHLTQHLCVSCAQGCINFVGSQSGLCVRTGVAVFADQPACVAPAERPGRRCSSSLRFVSPDSTALKPPRLTDRASCSRPF